MHFHPQEYGILVGGLEHFSSIYWECHHPNWGVETTNQYKHVSGRVAGVLLFRSVENCPFLRRRQLGLMVCPFCWATPRCSPAHDERTFFLPYNGSLCFTVVRYIWVLFINVIQQVSQVGIKKVDVSLFHPSLPDYKHMLTSLDFFRSNIAPLNHNWWLSNVG